MRLTKPLSILLPVLFIGWLLLLPWSVWAQTAVPTPTPAPTGDGIPQIHTVQEGENPTYIAETYGVTVADLLAVNGLTENDVLFVGQQLFVPGGQGDAVPTVYTVQAGDTIAGIAALFNTTKTAVLDSNALPNPTYQPLIGQSVTVVSRTGSAQPQTMTGVPHVVQPGETLLMIAAQYALSPAELAAQNGLVVTAHVLPGQRLRIPAETPYRDLPGEWLDVQIRPLSLAQGGTASIFVRNLLNGRPSGEFAGQPLRFFPHEDGFAALVGIDAFTEPGIYTLRLEGTGERPWRPFQQELRIASSNYGLQQIVLDEAFNDLLDPTVRQEEDAYLATFYNTFTEPQQWEGLFQMPVTTTIITAPYGDSRSYNGGPVEIYHTGVDFAGTVGTPILAAANGTVVFSDTIRLRGLTLIIDHGVGVISAYFHLSESFVTVGEQVKAGQQIASGGSTGLSTGPHLHWDLRVNNVPVNGLEWLERPFP